MGQRSVVFSGLLLATVVSGLVSVAGCPTGGTGGPGGAFNLPPVPIITSDVTRGVAPLTVSFGSDRSTDDGLIVSRRWEFGDGTSSQDIRPTKTYTTTGDFVVRLTLTDEQGATASRTQTISVTEAPTAVINVDRTSAPTAPATFNFDASQSFDPDGSIASYRWEFGDGSVELLPVVPHTFSTSGVYRVRLIVTDDKGITSRDEVLISVGIRTPTVEVRVPSPNVKNLVLSPSSPLFVQAVYSLEAGVTRTIRAGLDGDRDQCNSQAIVASTGTLASSLILAGHAAEVTDAAWSPDGAFIATVSSDATVRVYNTTNGDLVASFPTTSAAACVAFTPDSTQIATGESNGRIVLRNRATGATIREITAHTAGVTDIDFSADGALLASAGNDNQTLVFRMSDGALLRTFVGSQPINAVAFSPVDSNRLASAGEDSIVRLLDVGSGATTAALSGHAEAVNDLAFSPDGTRLASAGDDDAIRVWEIPSGTLLGSLAGHVNDVLAVSFNADGSQLVSGAADGTLRLWNAETLKEVRRTQPCSSPLVAAVFSPDGQRVLTGVSARNDFQLDTNPPNGNDLNVTYPQALRLKNVASLNGGTVPPGVYFLWVELRTDRGAPVRAYASATINVIGEYANSAANNPPLIPLIDEEASIVVDPNASRQVFDIGSLNQGDRIFLSLAATPGMSPAYSAGLNSFGIPKDFSLAVVDSNESIFAWYQPDFILFTPEARLVLGAGSPNHYVITDGGNSVNVRIERNTGLSSQRSQRVWVNFNGASDVAAGGQPPVNIFPLNAATYNQFFTVSPGWGPNETAELRASVMQTLRSKFAAYNVQFTGSNESAEQPTPPFMTLQVGNVQSALLYGIADYIDPRNDTQSGTGIVYGLTIGQDVIESPFVMFPVTTPAGLGAAIGNVAAHECGHLLGLRHTDDANDLMASGFAQPDPTVQGELRAALVSAFEQIDLLPPFGVPDVPPIGIQDAPELLAETIGAAP